MSRQFEDKPAVREMTPLLVGLAGPSGCGKTYSALRIAKGIQEVTGGEIFGIDTEGRRMLHYADDFKFRHVPFGPDFRSLDYLDAVRHCATKGARVIVVDSMSHEHEGKGGFLEFHAEEESRMHGNAAAKFAAWQEPSKKRNQLIGGLLQLPISFVFCFRAKEKLKPGKEQVSGQEKSVMRELGWMPIGGKAFIYEMTVCCLLPPGCNGVPSWDVDSFSEEQKLWIKKPKQFIKLFKNGLQLSEAVGKELALWSNGGNPPAANWQEEQQKAVAASIAPSTDQPQVATGPDQSEPCPLCKNNPPRCKNCQRELIFTPAGISRRGDPYNGFWRCPDKCKDQDDKRRNTNRTATDWHAILEGDKKLKDEREGQLFQAEPGATG
jgi:energy-coupling factor transporter ATP-binding protein EcfA2